MSSNALASDWQRFYQAAKQAQQKQNYPAAIEAYTRALELAPAEIKLYRLRAESWQYLHEFAKAHQDLAQAMALSPDNPSLYEALGWLAIYEQNYPAARQALQQALSIDPDFNWARLNLGHAWLLDPQQSNAIELAIMTWRPLIGTRLGKFKFEEALQKDLQRLQALFPDTSHTAITAARSWLQDQE